jgi:dephospho-CoA kinase
VNHHAVKGGNRPTAVSNAATTSRNAPASEPQGRLAIGLTGGIGSGKSMVADMLAARGAAIVDTDIIAHQLTAPGGAAMPAIRAAFGNAFVTPDGSLDRKAMREHVFSDPSARKQLEAILHPLIGAETEAAALRAGGLYLVFVVPLLVESGRWIDRVHRVLVVDCPESVQLERVMRRNHLSHGQVEAIMSSQASRAQRLAAADDVIVNDADREALEQQVARLHDAYLVLARSGPEHGGDPQK